jgi:hypothetical protein
MAGMIRRLVMNALPLMGRFNSRAMPRPRRSCSVIAGKMIRKVLIHDRQTRVSSSISW